MVTKCLTRVPVSLQLDCTEILNETQSIFYVEVKELLHLLTPVHGLTATGELLHNTLTDLQKKVCLPALC